MAFKDRLKKLRTERGITQEDLAQALDMPSSTIRRYESSDEGMPKHERLQIIADYFDCTVDYLLERTNERHAENKKENDFSIPESEYERMITEAENEFGVTLRDDPIVEGAIREMLWRLAQMKKQ